MKSPVSYFPIIWKRLKELNKKKIRLADLHFIIEEETPVFKDEVKMRFIKGMERHGYLKKSADEIDTFWILANKKPFDFFENKEEEIIDKMIEGKWKE